MPKDWDAYYREFRAKAIACGELVIVDDNHARCAPGFVARLMEYSASLPTGVYDGKLWKRAAGASAAWLLGAYERRDGQMFTVFRAIEMLSPREAQVAKALREAAAAEDAAVVIDALQGAAGA